MRPFLAIIGVLSAVFFSPIAAAACIVIMAILFDAWEAVVLGFIVDMLWLPNAYSLSSLPLFTLGAMAIVWVLAPLRAQFLR